MSKNGGYDIGYESCPCFWGTTPGSLVLELSKLRDTWNGAQILDLGCGEGKNAMHFISLEANVIAVDVSLHAISNAKAFWKEQTRATWIQGDVLELTFPPLSFDAILLYGLPHCLETQEQISFLIEQAKQWTKCSGFIALATFNNRYQELHAHPNFKPLLESHTFYADFFRSWHIYQCSDTDLTESHPHNHIKHVHSMTRLLARKPA